MKILFVAMPSSIHTARWIKQLEGSGHDLHLFPSTDEGPIHPSLRDLVTYHPEFSSSADGRSGKGIPTGARLLAVAGNYFTSKLFPDRRLQRLVALIRRLRPDVVHSLELQAAGYLTLQARLEMGDQFPVWAVSNWGSDIYLFGRLAEHRPRLRNLLEACDYYLCECRRDVALAHDLGLSQGKATVLPGGGGIELARLAPWRAVPPSKRKRVLLKGYQGWAGRALCGLRAFELAADALRNYEIVVYLANSDVELKARVVAEQAGLQIRVAPHMSHDKMMQLQGQARISIGLSISDGASTSFLEALAMGAFPIQSDTACANEWIAPGSSGLLVPPEDPELVAQALRQSLNDDTMVDDAARFNSQVVQERLGLETVRPRVRSLYEAMA